MTFGLVLFIMVVFVDAWALVTDLRLLLRGLPTITAWLRQRWWRMMLAIAFQLLGAAGLAWHLIG